VPTTISDFVQGVDHIDLTAIDGNSSLSGQQHLAYVGSDPGAIAHSVTWNEVGGNTIVQADVTGGTTPDMTIIITGINHHLTQSDFIL